MQLGGADVHAVVGHGAQLDLLVDVPIDGNADGGHLHHPRVGQGRLLDLPWRQDLPPAPDGVAPAPGEDVLPVVVTPDQVAGVVPTVAVPRGDDLPVVAEVALEHVEAVLRADPQLAVGARGCLLAAVGDDPGLEARARAPDGARPLGDLSRPRPTRCRLGLAPDVDHLTAEAILERRPDQRRSTGAHDPPYWVVGVVGPGRTTGEHREDGPHEAEHDRVGLAQAAPEPVGVEAGLDDGAPASVQRGQDRPLAGGVRERETAEHGLARLQGQQLVAVGPAPGRFARPAPAHALGRPRRARGVHELGRRRRVVGQRRGRPGGGGATRASHDCIPRGTSPPATTTWRSRGRLGRTAANAG